MAKGKRAVFLDRDGTLNFDPGYVRHPDELVLMPGVGEALKTLKDLGYLLVVVSNQSGVARGLIPINLLDKIHERFNQLLQPFNVQIDSFELCVHHPRENCTCRKPAPGLILQAAQRLGIDLQESWMIGDRISDFEAGKAAGCRGSFLVRTGDGKSNENKLAANDLPFVIDHIRDLAQRISSL